MIRNSRDSRGSIERKYLQTARAVLFACCHDADMALYAWWAAGLLLLVPAMQCVFYLVRPGGAKRVTGTRPFFCAWLVAACCLWHVMQCVSYPLCAGGTKRVTGDSAFALCLVGSSLLRVGHTQGCSAMPNLTPGGDLIAVVYQFAAWGETVGSVVQLWIIHLWLQGRL